MGAKILWHSNAAFAPSGYGKQTYINCKRIQKMPEVEHLLISAFYGVHGGIIEYKGLTHIPPRTGDWGNQCLQLHSYHTNSDIVIGLQDTWVLRQDIAQLGFLWVPWVPIDHDPLPQMIADRVKTAYMPIAMSKWGEQKMLEYGISHTRYVPHSVETKVYKPYSDEVKKATRRRLGIPEDCFLVGIVAANKGFPARKSWPQMMEALQMFVAKHPDTFIYAHTLATPEEQGVDLPGIIKSFGLGDKVVLPNPYLYLMGFPDDEMSKIYSCFDVFLLPSMGEGFGVPIIEAQACGVPVIVTDFTAMPELVGAGHKVSVAYKWYTPLYSFQALPHIGEIVDALELQFNLSDKERKAQQKQARKFIVDNYDTDFVVNTHWKPIIQELAAVTEHRTISVN